MQMQHSATMARGTAKVMENFTTTSNPTSIQPTKKIISKGTTVTKSNSNSKRNKLV